MTKLIAAALAQLDHANDQHWTGDGLPRLETVRFFAGDSSITREAVTAAAPGFVRGAAAPAAGETGAGAPQTAPEGAGSTEAPSVAPAPAQGPSQGDSDAEAGPEIAGEGSDTEAQAGKPSEDAMEAAISALNAARGRKAEAERDYAAASAAVDALVKAIESTREDANVATAVSGYLKSQQAIREERTRRMQALKGINLRDILPQKSPLDDALRKRKASRSETRPVR